MHQRGCISIKTNLILTSVSPQVRASTEPQAVFLSNHQPSSPSPVWFTWNVYLVHPSPLPLHPGFAQSSVSAGPQANAVSFFSATCSKGWDDSERKRQAQNPGWNRGEEILNPTETTGQVTSPAWTGIFETVIAGKKGEKSILGNLGQIQGCGIGVGRWVYRDHEKEKWDKMSSSTQE